MSPVRSRHRRENSVALLPPATVRRAKEDGDANDAIVSDSVASDGAAQGTKVGHTVSTRMQTRGASTSSPDSSDADGSGAPTSPLVFSADAPKLLAGEFAAARVVFGANVRGIVLYHGTHYEGTRLLLRRRRPGWRSSVADDAHVDAAGENLEAESEHVAEIESNDVGEVSLVRPMAIPHDASQTHS